MLELLTKPHSPFVLKPLVPAPTQVLSIQNTWEWMKFHFITKICLLNKQTNKTNQTEKAQKTPNKQQKIPHTKNPNTLTSTQLILTKISQFYYLQFGINLHKVFQCPLKK